jgi:hypothetical protein
MSLFKDLMDFTYSTTVQMLAGVANPPQAVVGHVTHMTTGSATLKVTSTAGMYDGETVTGAGIHVGTTITSVTDITTLVLSHAATATATIGNVIVGDPQNVAPLNYVDSVGVLSDPHLNYVFYLVNFENQNINQQLDVETNGAIDPTLTTRQTKYVRNLRIEWQLYGDDGMEWADTLRIMLFDPAIKDLFAAQGITLITDVQQAVFFPERINQQWYHRYDLHASFNQLVIKQTEIPAIAGTDIILESEKGVESECSILTA